MNPDLSRIVGAVAFFGVIFGSGYWLSHSGKPYSGLLLTIHKLVSLAAVVLLIVLMVRSNRATPLVAVTRTAGVVVVLFFVGTIVTGGLVSADTPMPQIVSTMHSILPFLTLLSTAVTLYLLSSRIT